MRLTKEDRVKIVKLHFQNYGVVSVQKNYRRIFGNETSPSKKCIKALTETTENKPRCERRFNSACCSECY